MGKNKAEPVTGDWGCFDRYPEEIAPPIKDSERDASAREVLAAMREAANAFYRSAIKIGHHQWIEHAGLMQEHLRMLLDLHLGGGCIWENTPELTAYAASYLGEKVNCIFGESFRKNPEVFEAFVRAARGEK
jgi:hypothetical protein